MYVLIILIILAFAAIIAVSLVNRAQEKERARRLQQRRLKIQADALIDAVNSLEQTIPNKLIAKYVNDEAIRRLQQVLTLETGPRAHLETSIRNAQLRSEDLSNGRSAVIPSYQKDSDTQITQTQINIDEAAKVLRHLCAQGKISNEELAAYIDELKWAHLMVSVISFIGQGNKFIALEDRLTAHGFYQKAQLLLMESIHQNPKRMKMIKELGEMLTENR